MTIPIVIGVTGHRDLREQDIPRLQELVRVELIKLKTEYPHSPLIMLSSLAAGADTLCAEVALELGIVLKCPLPMEADEYRGDFMGADLATFNALLAKADEVFAAPAAEPAPSENSRDFHYRQAGIYVAAHSHVMLALWDGSPAKPGGCGTAETVDFMLKGCYGCKDCLKAANDGAVIHIATPRTSCGNELTISTRLIENEPDSLREVLRMTDTFNSDSEAQICATKSELLPEEYISGSGKLKCLSALYHKADALSLHFQKLYLRAMGGFSAFGVLLVLSFLLYDELESNIFLLCYGLLIIVYFLAFILTRRGQTHMKYLQYRALSETLRVQFYLSATGSSENIGSSFTWTQKQDSTWVKEALSALLAGRPDRPDIPDGLIKTYWIEGQLAYHQNALRRDKRKHRISDNSARVMLLFSVALFIIVLVLEFLFSYAVVEPLFSGDLPVFLMPHDGQTVTVRSLLKIILGGVSAITVFLSNYYGKLSLERKSIDHEKMAGLYTAAREQFEVGRIDKEQLFHELAREEIIENGNWFSYCRENPPSFSI